jgi:GMP reductase
MKITKDKKLDFSNVLIRPKRSNLNSRSEVVLQRQFKFPHSKRLLECVPIFAANMDTTGSMNMAKALCDFNCGTCLHKHYPTDKLIEYFNKYNPLTFYSTGISSRDLEKLHKVFEAIDDDVPNICVDVANGYSENFTKVLADIRKQYPESIIMAGNVVTPEMVEELVLHGGVDIVKIGIGSGSVCTTRLKTGVGYPQLSAILECVDAAHGLNGHICSDGGCKIPADVCKAFGANADFVMLGSMLAGSSECEGDWQYEYRCRTEGEDDRRNKEWWQTYDPGYPTDKRKVSLQFYGMSSKEAMEKHHGGVANYRTSEGKCVTIPYKGTTDEIMLDILGGIRSACTYVGASTIKDISKKTTFIPVYDTHNKVYE